MGDICRLSEIGHRENPNAAERIEVLQPVIKRHPIGMKIVEHDVAQSYAEVPTVLRDRCLPAVVADADHEIPTTSASYLDHLPAMTGCGECTSDASHTLLTL